MLRDSAIALLKSRLGNRTDLDASILLEMQHVQSTILEGSGVVLPWFLESTMQTLTTSAGDESVSLPATFLGLIEEQPIWRYDATATEVYKKLHKRDYSTIVEKYTEAGEPKAYAVSGTVILLRPVPDAIYTLKSRFYLRDTDLGTGNVENNWLKYAADLFIAETGAIMASQYLQNPKLAQLFKDDATAARTRLYVQHEARQHAGRKYNMGED